MKNRGSTPSRRPGGTALLVLALPLTAAACAGPPMPSAVEGEPICTDFEIGATHSQMQGGLRTPVQLTVREGETIVARQTIYGRRNEKEPKTHLALTDDDAQYTVEWAQCANERAPRAVVAGRAPKEAATYECGETKAYKTEPLATKKGDIGSHTLTFPMPPSDGCWLPEAPPPPPPPKVDPPPPPPEPAPAPSASAAAPKGK